MTTAPGYNILIVDDSSTTRAFMRKAIVFSGVQVHAIHQAADGRRALDLMSHESIDVVLADLQMPEMDGEEMTRAIVADRARQDVAVIIVSADPNQDRIQSLLKAGAKGYIAKPFTAEAFRQMWQRVMGGVAHG